jgi:hypothetical protein
MEARDERNIRPLPPEMPEGHPPGGALRDRWRWVPIAAVAAVVIALGFAGSIISRDDADAGGADPFDAAASTSTTIVPSLSAEAATTTTTTTTTLPPTLQDLLPDVSEINAVVRSGSAGTTLRWTPRASDPTETDSSGRPDAASFNSDGTHLAYVSFFGDTGALHVGSDTFQPAQYVQVNSFAWHQTEPQRLAWVAIDPTEDELRLMTGTVEPASQTLEIDELSTPVPSLTHLVDWGDWGFLTARTVPDYSVESALERDPGTEIITMPLGITQLRDPDGTVVASTPGFVMDTSLEGTSLIWSAAEAYEVASAGATNRELGFTGTFVPPYPTGLYLALRDLTPHPNQPQLATGLEYVLSSDGVRVAEVFEGDAVALTTQNVGSPTTRVIGLEGPAHLLGFTSDQVWVLLHDEARSLLIFVDWRSGARRHLDLPGSGSVVAIYVDQPE